MAFERVARYTIIDSENKNERTVPEERERARLCEPDERENSGRGSGKVFVQAPVS
jgi:hypothetical protein